jgi:cytidine deaminase
MTNTEHKFSYQVYDSIDDLEPQDAALLTKARDTTAYAYAPYSNFRVGAVALLDNGAVVTGTNQENASYPVGICAERVLLASISSQYVNVPVNTIAISYDNMNGESNHPIAPCGMCRQSLVEFEGRMNQPIRLILSGKSGKIFIIPQSNALLPLSFNKEELVKD